MYLYRAVDSTGQTLDFLLNETRCTRAAKRFFLPLTFFVVGIDYAS
jgi:transposase-like protein